MPDQSTRTTRAEPPPPCCASATAVKLTSSLNMFMLTKPNSGTGTIWWPRSASKPATLLAKPARTVLREFPATKCPRHLTCNCTASINKAVGLILPFGKDRGTVTQE